VQLDIDVDVLIQSISIGRSINNEDAFALIAGIDERIADYDFTKRLADHFTNIIKKEDEIKD